MRPASTRVRLRVWLSMVFLFVWATQATRSLSPPTGIFARDGHGRPVRWFVVYKLPSLARSGPSGELQATPCDCAPPTCSQLPTETLNVTSRAAGLCYLYADSNNATLRHFREIGYDCLGQGGDDPVSHTLRQIQPASRETEPAPYWAIFNDQLNGIAESVVPPPTGVDGTSDKRVCSGSDVFSAHAKGAVAFDGLDGGFYFQTSTPNFPDPSRVGERSDRFIPLGCQKDNNVHFAQHVMGMSLDMGSLNSLGRQLQAARLCSGNFYHDLRTELASKQLLVDGGTPEKNTNISELFKALLNSSLEDFNASSTVRIQLRDIDSKQRRSKVYSPLLDGGSILSVVKTDDPTNAAEVVIVTVKTPRAEVPPWALLAEALASDLSVASWWDGSFGIPNICARDVYTNSSNHFCLDNAAHGVQLFSNGSAKFNIENLIEASWLLPNASEKLHWHLVGGSHRDGNHAKWGVSTPRYGPSANFSRFVTFADLNMEGFPCSTTCHGSQAGRGGSFFTFDNPQLHVSFIESLIAKACPCIPPSTRANVTFEELRMCHMGCWRKVQEHLQPNELPVMATEAASFWQHTQR